MSAYLSIDIGALAIRTGKVNFPLAIEEVSKVRILMPQASLARPSSIIKVKPLEGTEVKLLVQVADHFGMFAMFEKMNYFS